MARPRKLGKREKNGRPQRETAAEVRYVAGITRGRRMGWPMNASNRIDLIKKASEPLYGTEQGILYGRGDLGSGDLALQRLTAANEFQAAHAAQLNAIAAPRPYPANVSPGSSVERDQEDETRIANAARSRFADIRRSYDHIPDAERFLIMAIAQQNAPPSKSIPTICAALDAIYADHIAPRALRRA